MPLADVFFVQAVPNPFNPATRITFGLPSRERVEIRIYDPRGHMVRELLAAEVAAGPGAVIWDGRNDRGAKVATGVYLYRVQAGTEVRVGKLALIK